MADFYTILRTAVGDSVGYDREARELLYRRAREALTVQLDSLEAPLSDEQKAEQLAQLDDAAERVEAEFAGAEAGIAATVAAAAEGGVAQEQPVPEEPQQSKAPDDEPPADELKAAQPAADEVAVPAGDASHVETPGETADGEPVPVGEPEPETQSDTAEEPQRPHTSRRIAPPRREPRRAGRRWGLVIVLLVILGGAGLAAWRWQDVAPAVEQVAENVQAMLGEEETAPATEPAAAPAAPASAPDQTGAVREQEPAREQETAAAPAPAGVGTEPVSSGQAAEPAKEPDGELKGAVSPQSDENENRPDAGGDAEAAGESEAANTSGGEREVLAEKVIVPESALRKDQDRVAPSLPSAERAFMIIEQGSTGSDDLRLAGSAQWRLEGSGAEAVVTVTVQIPEREALVGFVMRRNNDDSLPASHMVDISYQGGDNKDGPIINVPGFMVRVEDSETPVPVRSAGALIMPGQYLLGLSGNEDDQAHNLLLLKTAQWLEIPAMFESKRRLVVVIEVGPSGTAALNGALAQWSEAGAGKTQEKAGE